MCYVERLVALDKQRLGFEESNITLPHAVEFLNQEDSCQTQKNEETTAISNRGDHDA